MAVGCSPAWEREVALIRAICRDLCRASKEGLALPTSVFIAGKPYTVVHITDLPTDGVTSCHVKLNAHLITYNALPAAGRTRRLFIVKPDTRYVTSSRFFMANGTDSTFNLLTDVWFAFYGSRFRTTDNRNINTLQAGFRLNGVTRCGLLGGRFEVPHGRGVTWTDSFGQIRLKGRSTYHHRFIDTYLNPLALGDRISPNTDVTSKDSGAKDATGAAISCLDKWVRVRRANGGDSVLTQRSNFVAVCDMELLGLRGSIEVSTSDNVLIENNLMMQSYSDCLHVQSGSANCTTRGNTIRESGDDGLPGVAYSLNTNVLMAPTENLWEYNHVFGCRVSGIHPHGGDRCVWRWNTVHDTLMSGIRITSARYVSGQESWGNIDVEIYENEVHGAVKVQTSAGLNYTWEPLSIYNSVAPALAEECIRLVVRDNLFVSYGEARSTLRLQAYRAASSATDKQSALLVVTDAAYAASATYATEKAAWTISGNELVSVAGLPTS